MDLLDHKATTEYALQCIRFCLENGNTEALQEHLRVHFTDSKLIKLDDEFTQLLYAALAKGKARSLQVILAHVDDAMLHSEVCKGGKSLVNKLLLQAIENGDRAVVECLTNRGADVNACYHGWPILHRAVCRDHLEVAEALITAGADIKALDRRGDGVVHNVINTSLHEHKVSAIRWLFTKDVDFQQKSTSGKSPIHAASTLAADVLGVLIENGHDVNIGNDVSNDTPLHIACSRACRETLLKLIQNGAKFNAENKYGHTPLALLLKSTQEVHDFHSKTRIEIAKRLISIGFRVRKNGSIHQIANSANRNRKGRDKLHDRYTALMLQSRDVPTLQNMSRCVAMETIASGVGVEKQINELDVPLNLKRYLLFRDFHLTP